MPFQASWTINMVVAKQDVTAFGDGNMGYVAGLPDASGDFGGFMDAATSQTYIPAVGGLARNFYLYPDATNSPTVYWFGTILPDFSADGAIGGDVEIKSSVNAAGRVERYPPTGSNNLFCPMIQAMRQR